MGNLLDVQEGLLRLGAKHKLVKEIINQPTIRQIKGVPTVIGHVAYSNESIDLGNKRDGAISCVISYTLTPLQLSYKIQLRLGGWLADFRDGNGKTLSYYDSYTIGYKTDLKELGKPMVISVKKGLDNIVKALEGNEVNYNTESDIKELGNGFAKMNSQPKKYREFCYTKNYYFILTLADLGDVYVTLFEKQNTIEVKTLEEDLTLRLNYTNSHIKPDTLSNMLRLVDFTLNNNSKKVRDYLIERDE